MLANTARRHLPADKLAPMSEDSYGVLSVDGVERLLDSELATILNAMTLSKRKSAEVAIRDRRAALTIALERHTQRQAGLGNRIQATAAAALIGARFVPAKMNPIIKGIMNGVKVSYDVAHELDWS